MNTTRALLWLVAVVSISCHAFAPNRVAVRARGMSSLLTSPPTLLPRSKETQLNGASLADYSGAAQQLFGNVISPAALLAGGLVPLGFLAAPLPGNSKLRQRLRSIYWLLAVLSLANELTAIVYATVASNKLTEIAAAPAASVFALIKRDYELSWIATNVHFLFGLFGFLSMIGLRAFTVFPCRLNKAAAGIAFSALLGMCSVVNRGVEMGDGAGELHGSNVVTLVFRYYLLLARRVKNQGGILSITAIALGIASMGMAIKAVVTCPDEDAEES